MVSLRGGQRFDFHSIWLLGSKNNLLEQQIRWMGMKTKLSVNLNKVAVIRNSRGTNVPSVIEAAKIAINAGADGITVHPRPCLLYTSPSPRD